ncbi:MAG: hypothetical protein AB7F64_03860 [Gammaproteobacteria bacterium]
MFNTAQIKYPISEHYKTREAFEALQSKLDNDNKILQVVRESAKHQDLKYLESVLKAKSALVPVIILTVYERLAPGAPNTPGKNTCDTAFVTSFYKKATASIRFHREAKDFFPISNNHQGYTLLENNNAVINYRFFLKLLRIAKSRNLREIETLIKKHVHQIIGNLRGIDTYFSTYHRTLPENVTTPNLDAFLQHLNQFCTECAELSSVNVMNLSVAVLINACVDFLKSPGANVEQSIDILLKLENKIQIPYFSILIYDHMIPKILSNELKASNADIISDMTSFVSKNPLSTLHQNELFFTPETLNIMNDLRAALVALIMKAVNNGKSIEPHMLSIISLVVMAEKIISNLLPDEMRPFRGLMANFIERHLSNIPIETVNEQSKCLANLFSQKRSVMAVILKQLQDQNKVWDNDYLRIINGFLKHITTFDAYVASLESSENPELKEKINVFVDAFYKTVTLPNPATDENIAAIFSSAKEKITEYIDFKKTLSTIAFWLKIYPHDDLKNTYNQMVSYLTKENTLLDPNFAAKREKFKKIFESARAFHFQKLVLQNYDPEHETSFVGFTLHKADPSRAALCKNLLRDLSAIEPTLSADNFSQDYYDSINTRLETAITSITSYRSTLRDNLIALQTSMQDTKLARTTYAYEGFEL